MNDTISYFLIKKVYFLSDFHLGAPDAASSLVREKRIVEFLEEIRKDAAVIFIVGDMFDFWYDTESGAQRICAPVRKLAELTIQGSPSIFFGQSRYVDDDYFQQELNIPVYFEPKEYEFNEKNCS